MSSSGRSSNIRARRQPWFGVVVTLVVVAVVIAGSFALKAFGDSRDDGSDSANRGAAGGESLNIVLKNSSSVTIAIGVINVKREEWNFPAPDSAAPKGLQGAWIDPGESLSVTLSLDNPTNPHSPFKVTTTPMAGSSIGGVITLFGQLTYTGGGEFSSGSSSFWTWPTSDVPSNTPCTMVPKWSGPAGSYQLKGGRSGSITATATCQGTGDTAVITFTDTKS